MNAIAIRCLLLATLGGFVACASGHAEVSSELRLETNGIDIDTWTWAPYTRPDGSTGFWDPKPIAAMGGTLVNVIYGAKDTPDRVVYGGLEPPKLHAETLSNCVPELVECHKHGIKVIGYANTEWFHPVMMDREGLDWTDLSALDIHGKPVINYMWEKRGAFVSCVSNPKWLELQEALVMQTADAGFDGLQFDLNPYAVPPGFNCHCHYCQQKWKDYSKSVFGIDKPLPGSDIGESDYSKMDLTSAVNRVYIEWRHEELASFLKAIEKHVRRKHPEFLLSFNHAAGDPNFAVLSLRDAIKVPSSELWHLKLGEDSSLYAYRLTEALSGEKCIGLVNYEDQIKPLFRFYVGVAEAYAGGGAFYFGPTHNAAMDFSRFLRDNQDLYVGTSSEAAVGVLYSWHDQNFVLSPGTNGALTVDLNRFRRAAALLARKNVPYDAVVVEKGLRAKELSKYKVIVAPELRLLNDKDSAALGDYVRSGGHLLSIGSLGDLREVKKEYVKRMPATLTAWTGNKCQTPWHAEMGAGRVAYVPRAWTGDSESAMKVTSEFAEAADYLGLYSQLRLKAETPVEATIRGKGDNKTIHLIRLGAVDDLGNRSVRLNYELPNGYHVASAKAHPLEFPEKLLAFTWKESKGHLEAELNRLDNYAVISVELRK